MTKNIITISPNAKKRIIQLYQNQQDSLLKISVIAGGCNGLSYNFAFIKEDDIFSDDEIIEDDIKIVIDGYGIMFLVGSELDYIEELSGSQFVFKNPNQANSCGCGSSFSV